RCAWCPRVVTGRASADPRGQARMTPWRPFRCELRRWRVDELWSSDYEVLHWLVERFERSGQRIKEHEILATFPEDRHDDVRQSLRRLATHGYINGARSGGGLGGHADVVHDVVGVHERALRAVGAWPDNAEVLADRMLAVLAERAANEPDPARRSKFAAGLKGVGGMTRDLFVEVTGSVISKSVGGG
ncbi:MAG: hypothetical protein LC799_02060, partial [Actinobacteria bacterium]|nr:hypothetical protein [Actinomycetota bacterium]